MLSCLFGKCSSDKYIVNKVPRSGTGPNGVIISHIEPDQTTLPVRDHNRNQERDTQQETTSQSAQNGHAIAVTEGTATHRSDLETREVATPHIEPEQIITPSQDDNHNQKLVAEQVPRQQTTQNGHTVAVTEGTGTHRSDLETREATTPHIEPEQIITLSQDDNHNQKLVAEQVPRQQTTENGHTVAVTEKNEIHRSVLETREVTTPHIEPEQITASQPSQDDHHNLEHVAEQVPIPQLTQNGHTKAVTAGNEIHRSELETSEVTTAHIEPVQIITPSQDDHHIQEHVAEQVIIPQPTQNGNTIAVTEEINQESESIRDQFQTSTIKKDEQKVPQSQVKTKSQAPKPPPQKSETGHQSESKSSSREEHKVATANGDTSKIAHIIDTTSEAISNETNQVKQIEDEIVVSREANEIKQIEEEVRQTQQIEEENIVKLSNNEEDSMEVAKATKRRSGIVPLPVKYDENAKVKFKINPKTEAEETLIKRAIEENDFLNKIIVKKRLEDVVKAMYKKTVSAKEIIVRQGEKGSHMYISEKGKFQVLIKNKVVSEFRDVRVFGELAILYNAKRLATIKAVTAGKVWVLDRNVFQQIIVGFYIKEQDEILQFLLNNNVLKEAGEAALQEVANLLKSEFYKPGTQIVRQGDKGNKFYIIRAGTVTITKDGEGVVSHCKKGDCFGELALLKEDCRQATVTADAPGVECLTLTRKEFIEHFGEVEALSNLTVQPKGSFGVPMPEYEDLNLNDLKIIRTLGVGGFGRVELVQHKKKSDLVFALKYLKKMDIVMQHQQEHVYNEKNIQMNCRSPFIVRLYRTYKDNKYIYLLMESCLGGDLWSLLQKQKMRRFDEKEARFIAGCVLESFEYLHSRGIIYRDLKPENLLIAANGYIKLTDFGFAKKISSRGKTFTFAGTPEYVAPEIVLNRGHDKSVDYWAFGVFIFELLSGRTPFRTDDSSHMKTYNKILSGIDNIQFPSYVNLKAKHIVEKLCRPVPSERLGMQRGGIEDIKNHKWFLGFDWQKFSKCEIPSPFKPKLKSPIDTQYFDQFKKDNDIPPDEDSGWDKQF